MGVRAKALSDENGELTRTAQETDCNKNDNVKCMKTGISGDGRGWLERVGPVFAEAPGIDGLDGDGKDSPVPLFFGPGFAGGKLGGFGLASVWKGRLRSEWAFQPMFSLTGNGCRDLVHGMASVCRLPLDPTHAPFVEDGLGGGSLFSDPMRMEAIQLPLGGVRRQVRGRFSFAEMVNTKQVKAAADTLVVVFEEQDLQILFDKESMLASRALICLFNGLWSSVPALHNWISKDGWISLKI